MAYRDAFPNSEKWKDTTVDSKASVLFGKVLERYNEILAEQKNDALLTRWEKRKLLADIHVCKGHPTEKFGKIFK